MAARSIWKGSVGFGLVNIPCKLYGATEAKAIKFNQLHRRCNAKIAQKKACTACGEILEAKDIVKGYEVGKGQYVVMEDSDFAQVPVKTMQSVEVIAFMGDGKIDPRYLEKSYFLAPDEKLGAKAFSLFLQAMNKVNMVGLVKLVYREREHLATVRPFGQVILLQTLFYADELRPVSEVQVALPKVSDKEMELGVMLLKNMVATEVDLTQYKDEYREALQGIIQAKFEGKVMEVKPVEEKPATDDVVAALMASLNARQPAAVS